MYIDRAWMIATAEEALCMKAVGHERWCISWLEWLWRQEIERAILSVKQDRP